MCENVPMSDPAMNNEDDKPEDQAEAVKAALTFHVVTLFPEMIDLYCQTSIIGRGIKAGKLEVLTYSPRNFALDKYRKVDDTPYGGGAGMVLKPEPMFACVESIKRPEGSPVLLMTPQGRIFDQSLAAQLSQESDITFICGHYEGFDERIRSLATMEVSLGDYVLTGGELPALTIIDAVGRLMSHLTTASWRDRNIPSRPSFVTWWCRRCCAPAITRQSTAGGGKRLWKRLSAIGRIYLKRHH